MKIKDLIKNNTVDFVEYRKGFLYYKIKYQTGTETHPSFSYSGIDERPVYETYKFPVPIVDIGDASFPAQEKAIFFMRYLNQAMRDNTLVKI